MFINFAVKSLFMKLSQTVWMIYQDTHQDFFQELQKYSNVYHKMISSIYIDTRYAWKLEMELLICILLLKPLLPTIMFRIYLSTLKQNIINACVDIFDVWALDQHSFLLIILIKDTKTNLSGKRLLITRLHDYIFRPVLSQERGNFLLISCFHIKYIPIFMWKSISLC